MSVYLDQIHSLIPIHYEIKAMLLALPMMLSGSAFSQINNQITSAQSPGDACRGSSKDKYKFENHSGPGAGGFLFYNSNLTTGSIAIN